MDQAEQLRNIIKASNVAPRPVARVITVTSGKGGVGKSNTSINGNTATYYGGAVYGGSNSKLIIDGKNDINICGNRANRKDNDKVDNPSYTVKVADAYYVETYIEYVTTSSQVYDEETGEYYTVTETYPVTRYRTHRDSDKDVICAFDEIYTNGFVYINGCTIGNTDDFYKKSISVRGNFAYASGVIYGNIWGTSCSYSNGTFTVLSGLNFDSTNVAGVQRSNADIHSEYINNYHWTYLKLWYKAGQAILWPGNIQLGPWGPWHVLWWTWGPWGPLIFRRCNVAKNEAAGLVSNGMIEVVLN